MSEITFMTKCEHGHADCPEDCWDCIKSELAAVKKELEDRGYQFQKSMNALLLELKEAKRLGDGLTSAATRTLEALVSYKRYTPEPYKQNPIYIMGSAEAEELTKKALAAWEEFRGRAK